MPGTDADGVTRLVPAPVEETSAGVVRFASTEVALDHRAFWISDTEDEESLCIPYVDLPAFMETLMQLGLIAGWTPVPTKASGRRCIMCGERGGHQVGCGNAGWQ